MATSSTFDGKRVNSIAIHNTAAPGGYGSDHAQLSSAISMVDNPAPTREEVKNMVNEELIDIIHAQAHEINRLKAISEVPIPEVTKLIADLQNDKSLMSILDSRININEAHVAVMTKYVHLFESIYQWELEDPSVYISLMSVVRELSAKVVNLEATVNTLTTSLSSSEDEDMI